jgi:hypothetical protein
MMKTALYFLVVLMFFGVSISIYGGIIKDKQYVYDFTQLSIQEQNCRVINDAHSNYRIDMRLSEMVIARYRYQDKIDSMASLDKWICGGRDSVYTINLIIDLATIGVALAYEFQRAKG